MKAKKCDRCGKLYEQYNHKSGNKPNAVKTINENMNGNYYAVDIYDLCPECMNQLNGWLKNEKEGDLHA